VQKGSNPVRATRIAFAGLAAAAREELSFKLELAALVVVIPLGLYLGKTGVERALLVGSMLLVPMVELINSGIEASIDRISLERHPLAKRAKDVGAAAVFVSIVNACAVWALVLLG
jgi:diacylglycerol kinase (ATP)